MDIHTFNLGFYEEINIKLPNIKIWYNTDIINLIKKKYPEYLDFYNQLVLNKSKENFARLLFLKEYGGLYINIYLLSDNQINSSFVVNAVSSQYDQVFWKNHFQSDIVKNLYNINGTYISDEIFYFRNKDNTVIDFLIDNINKNIIPNNEYDNKIYLGDVFLSKFIDKFYYEKSINWTDNTTYSIKKSIKENDPIIKSLLKTKLRQEIILDNYLYKNNINPNIEELSDPNNYIDSWNLTHKITYIINHFIILVVYYSLSSEYFLICLLLSVVTEWIFLYIIKQNCKPYILQSQIDNKLFFDVNNFRIFNDIIKNWKVIAKEAKYVLDNAPKLNISRKYDEWKDSTTYIKKIKNEYGWIKSWKSPDNQDVVNKAWENYGLVYNTMLFKNNVNKCPKTYKLLKKIKKHINICGFSYMKGNCILEKHVDCTGIEFNSLAFHLGLIIPTPNNTCKLVVKSKDNGRLYSINEEPGKPFIFDATNEHYAYNQSSDDRVIFYMDFKN